MASSCLNMRPWGLTVDPFMPLFVREWSSTHAQVARTMANDGKNKSNRLNRILDERFWQGRTSSSPSRRLGTSTSEGLIPNPIRKSYQVP